LSVLTRRFEGVTEQFKASVNRLKDAEELAARGRLRGCVYLAGYAVECRLKWKLMSEHRAWNLKQLGAKLAFDPFTHDFTAMGARLGGWHRLERNPQFAKVWEVVTRWRVSWRYGPETL
jgi:hypothetical protein